MFIGIKSTFSHFSTCLEGVPITLALALSIESVALNHELTIYELDIIEQVIGYSIISLS
jgi:hypothetical protein